MAIYILFTANSNKGVGLHFLLFMSSVRTFLPFEKECSWCQSQMDSLLRQFCHILAWLIFKQWLFLVALLSFLFLFFKLTFYKWLYPLLHFCFCPIAVKLTVVFNPYSENHPASFLPHTILSLSFWRHQLPAVCGLLLFESAYSITCYESLNMSCTFGVASLFLESCVSSVLVATLFFCLWYILKYQTHKWRLVYRYSVSVHIQKKTFFFFFYLPPSFFFLCDYRISG